MVLAVVEQGNPKSRRSQLRIGKFQHITKPDRMKINQGMDRLRPWAKPEEEWYKVNVDAALHSATGRMGFGVYTEGGKVCHEGGLSKIILESDTNVLFGSAILISVILKIMFLKSPLFKIVQAFSKTY